MNATTFVTAPAERRHVARVLTFDARHVGYVDWSAIAATARELGTHFEARTNADGAMVVTMFWSVDDEPLQASADALRACTGAVQVTVTDGDRVAVSPEGGGR